jgi:methylmalonyl-CoA mutase
MNSLSSGNIFFRSLATRRRGAGLAEAVPAVIELFQRTGFDLILIETSGIGQGDTDIVDVADVSLYVMTSEFGAASQLEKIDMLDYADCVVLNKFDKPESLDALRAVRKQWRRNKGGLGPEVEDDDLPVFGTIASRFNDPGLTALFHAVVDQLEPLWAVQRVSSLERVDSKITTARDAFVPLDRKQYLAEVAATCRDYRSHVMAQANIAKRLDALRTAREIVGDDGGGALGRAIAAEVMQLDRDQQTALEGWDDLIARYSGEELAFEIRGKAHREPLYSLTLAGIRVPRVAVPRYIGWADRLRWLGFENVPGTFPFTAGVFPFKRRGEEPQRQFAGEGPPERTNRRFHYLADGQPAKRLSTAFDSVTLYGEDPHTRPDIYGKVGESGVSICTLDDMKKLYAGFDLCAESTSVSMTINGPAPIILAMFLNTAIDQQLDQFADKNGRAPNAEEAAEVAAQTLRVVRGTVQADILKEDQAQNTCIFNTEFALKMMGDMQEYFIEHHVRNYYSVSVSGYHIAEAGANPISQLAFTLANGLTYVEYYLSRGMAIDDFAPNLSFFFSNAMDAEYSVMGRVARRIWAVAMRGRYGAGKRSQKLKYHVQTSGRSLHAQEVQFNDIRTTLQALMALYDNCNSLHTNAFDEAVTTPTEASVRRAMAIQLIINRELGTSLNENPTQGAFVIDELTDLVEEAVLSEFEELSARGGVLGAMEREYQRSKIQEESLLYESRKHSGELPIIGVNTFLGPEADQAEAKIESMTLTRATAEEKQLQLDNLRDFQERHNDEVAPALKRLCSVAIADGNIFEELLRTVRCASLGQITHTLFEVGGKYRRNM